MKNKTKFKTESESKCVRKQNRNIDQNQDIIPTSCQVMAFLCIHVTHAYRSSPPRIVGAGIYDTPTPKLAPGLIPGIKPIAVAMMSGVTKKIAERRLIKMLKLMSKYYEF